MRNYKVDPLFRGPRSRDWPRDQVFTFKEVLDRVRKKNLTVAESVPRRLDVCTAAGRVTTRLVLTTHQATSFRASEPKKAYVVMA
jgi:hypothetical protein